MALRWLQVPRRIKLEPSSYRGRQLFPHLRPSRIFGSGFHGAVDGHSPGLVAIEADKGRLRESLTNDLHRETPNTSAVNSSCGFGRPTGRLPRLVFGDGGVDLGFLDLSADSAVPRAFGVWILVQRSLPGRSPVRHGAPLLVREVGFLIFRTGVVTATGLPSPRCPDARRGRRNRTARDLDMLGPGQRFRLRPDEPRSPVRTHPPGAVGVEDPSVQPQKRKVYTPDYSISHPCTVSLAPPGSGGSPVTGVVRARMERGSLSCGFA